MIRPVSSDKQRTSERAAFEGLRGLGLNVNHDSPQCSFRAERMSRDGGP